MTRSLTMQAAAIYFHGKKAGMLIEDENGYHFAYEADYLLNEDAQAVSLTLPLRKETYHSQNLFPFFDGLIPEGWLLHIAEKNLTPSCSRRERFKGFETHYCWFMGIIHSKTAIRKISLSA